MSDRTNEYEKTGGNYPDRRDADTPSSDESSDGPTADGAGAAERGGPGADEFVPSGTAPEATRMEQNVATEDDRLEGIVVQTRADLGDETGDKVEHLLRTRLRDAGIDLDDADVSALVERVRSGDR